MGYKEIIQTLEIKIIRIGGVLKFYCMILYFEENKQRKKKTTCKEKLFFQVQDICQKYYAFSQYSTMLMCVYCTIQYQLEPRIMTESTKKSLLNRILKCFQFLSIKQN